MYFKIIVIVKNYYTFVLTITNQNTNDMKNLIGKFTTEENCIADLRNQGFIFYKFNSDNKKVFYNKNINQVAEVHVYIDKSASALIGNLTK